MNYGLESEEQISGAGGNYPVVSKSRLDRTCRGQRQNRLQIGNTKSPLKEGSR